MVQRGFKLHGCTNAPWQLGNIVSCDLEKPHVSCLILFINGCIYDCTRVACNKIYSVKAYTNFTNVDYNPFGGVEGRRGEGIGGSKWINSVQKLCVENSCVTPLMRSYDYFYVYIFFGFSFVIISDHNCCQRALSLK